MIAHAETPTRLFDITERYLTNSRRHRTFIYRGGPIDPCAFLTKAENLGASLIKSGIKRNDTVALLSDNRPDWNLVDVAVMLAGGVLLPLCKGLSAEEYIDCLKGSNTKLLIIEDALTFSRLRLILPQIASIETIMSIDAIEGLDSISDLSSNPADEAFHTTLQQRKSMTTTDDICTLIYTGGGCFSKLTHRELIQEIEQNLPDHKAPARLTTATNPLCTKYGRIKNYVNQYIGTAIEYPYMEQVDAAAENAPQRHHRASKLLGLFDLIF